MEIYFKKWLNVNNLENSVDSYTSALKNITKHLLNINLNNINIFSYDSLESFQKLKENIEQDQEFKILNNKHHNVYSVALNHYFNFLKEFLKNQYNDNEQVLLFRKFQKEWTIERIKQMKLEEYSSIGNKNTFIYWLEKRLERLGSIWGGSSFKFGIYNRKKSDKKENKKGLIYNEHYAWYLKYGKTQQEAFNNIKKLIIEVINAIENNNLNDIENIDLGEGYKWKIAFHYQDINNPSVLAIFKKEVLSEYLLNNKLSFAAMEKTIKNKENIKNFDKLLEVSEQIWQKYMANFTNTDRGEKGISIKQRIEILKSEENIKKEIRILARSRNVKKVKERKIKDNFQCQNLNCKFFLNGKIVEVHHLKPLFSSDDPVITELDDLITLCPTCHRIAHYILNNDSKNKKISENESFLTNKDNLLIELGRIVKK